MENQHTKYYALQVSALMSLCLSLIFLLVILFAIIDVTIFPLLNPSEDYRRIRAAQANIPMGIAIVVVFFPTYLILNRSINKLRRTDTKGSSFLVTSKWTYRLLVLAGGVMLGDLSYVIMAALWAPLHLGFLLQAGAVFLVVGVAFYYYLLDVRGFWVQNKIKSTQFAIVITIIIVATLGYGMANIEMPESLRQQELDRNQVSDLQDIQWRIIEYHAVNQKLPESLDALGQLGEFIRKAPEGRPAYLYNLTEKGFKLCATFAQDSKGPIIDDEIYLSSDKSPIIKPGNWSHSAGEFCFERVMNKKE